MVRLIFLGDIVGRPGRRAVQLQVPKLREKYGPDVVIANGENSAGGFGIQPDTADEIFKAGVDLITTGNHVWSKREAYGYLDAHKDAIVRPVNFASPAPGAGMLVHTTSSGARLLLVNLIGRVFMPDLVDCPFRAMDDVFSSDEAKVPGTMIFCDFHAEATSEKVAFGHFVDGKATAVVGTHTHVQTSDDRILPGGTAYLSDAGMCGPENGVLGCEKEPIIEKFRTGRPQRFDVAKGPVMVNGVYIEADASTGKATKVERIYERFVI